jgi:hypothetical protein
MPFNRNFPDPTGSSTTPNRKRAYFRTRLGARHWTDSTNGETDLTRYPVNMPSRNCRKVAGSDTLKRAWVGPLPTLMVSKHGLLSSNMLSSVRSSPAQRDSGHRVAGRQRLRVPGSDSHLGAFLDADDFHSAANKDKMHRGVALTDDDRRD